MTIIFRAIHCASDSLTVYFLKDIIHTVIQETIPGEEILDVWKKHCFPRTFITCGLGSFNKHEWPKDWVYSVSKLGEKTLPLCNSKGYLKRQVELEVNMFTCCQAHPWHTLGTGMTQDLASARNNFQRHFWGSLSVSEHKRALPFVYLF